MKRRTPLKSRAGRMKRKIPKYRAKKSSVTKMADQLCGQLVKERDNHTCRKCGDEGPTDWAHIVPRRFRRTRWDLLNAVALCRSCHSWLDTHPHTKRKWAIDLIGQDAYDELWIRAEDDSLPKVNARDVLAELRALRDGELT